MSSVSSEPGTGALVSSAVDPQRAQRIALFSALMLTALVALVFWQFLVSQVRFAVRHQADWGHTLVIPFIAGYFIWLGRDRLAATPLRTTWIALVPVVLGIAMYVFFWLGPPAIRHHNLQAFGLSLTIFGLVLLFFGFRAMTVLWFPLLYLFVFGQTISPRIMNHVTYPMQDLAARGSWVLLKLIGMDAERSGNLLTVYANGNPHHLNIAEACSGMRMLMAFLALGVFMAFTQFKTFWQRATMVALGIPIAILVNLLRVVTLAVLSIYDANFAAGDFHTFVGLLWLVPAFVMYLGVAWVLRHLVVETPRATASPRKEASA